jgi:nucleoid-associated protein YgaU|tara:strand:- start:795 stop:1070 length:276 start_codon:yes stop_codon:yes gene_type:complete
MARYDETNIRKNQDTNKSYYNTTIYKEVPERNDDMYFISTEGDRCDNLAFRFYGDSTLWWFIARVNNLTTNNIPAGTSLRIPVSKKDARGF